MKKQPRPLRSSRISRFGGTARVPGDKSMSHRAVMFGLIAEGETIISGLLEGEDVLGTIACARALGAQVSGDDGWWRIEGTGGKGGLREPASVLDMGNSGTGARLLAGLVAGYPVTATLTGDASLVKRPMQRVIAPLTQMGAQVLCREGGRLPLTLRGASPLKAIEYKMPVASAQVKSAILLAGLRAGGRTVVIEERASRDHTENMLAHFGVEVTRDTAESGAHIIGVTGGQAPLGCAVDIPGDPSSAAFPAVAACLIEGAELELPHVGVNPRRAGLYEVLRAMGAEISFARARVSGGEPVADLSIRGGAALKGIDVPPELVPAMIDEFPILAIAAACAEGTTRMSGLAELRVKESDRLAMIARGLEACGAKLEEGEDSLIIHGTGRPPKGGALVETALDHRIAMSFLVLGMVSEEPVEIDDSRVIDTSFPGFAALMNRLGADFQPFGALDALRRTQM
jgi:3-phosphoshikimate 1-carboxyvinyltransferase